MKRLLLTLLLLPQLAFAACITDDSGEKVCLDAAPLKAVSLYGAWSELLWELGAGQSIIARTKSDTTIPQMEKLPVVGTGLRPNLEYVLALAPDLVLARGGKAGMEALTALKERGVKVAAFDPQSLDELYAVIARLGVLWQKEKEAAKLKDSLSAGMAEVRKAAAGAKTTPTVVFEVTAEPLMVAGTDGLLNELIEAAGGRNAVTVPKKLVRLDAEALLAANPDFYLVQTGPMNQNPQPPADRAHHGKLTAVKEGRVVTVDEKLYSRPGPNVAEAARELYKLLHPGAAK